MFLPMRQEAGMGSIMLGSPVCHVTSTFIYGSWVSISGLSTLFLPHTC